ncbi:5-oxoprolinase subunit B family protein [Nocardia aobensis]|uniref:5-oxoprolinase subunit B family protein n=1 Tax=Nocardia aobensis TaxID=257277 RepID=UPI0002E93B6C|nr:carboxyltransferase domain-containing protein [Nocardia aobensis]
MSVSRAILRTLAGDSTRPAMHVKQAGDNQILIEYDDMELDLRLNFRVQALRRALVDHPIDGVTETAPGFRSVMLAFDPGRIARPRLLDEVVEREKSTPDTESLVLSSRTVTLPIAFDDEMTREAVRRYRITTRNDAPNVSDGDNIDYIVRYNGFLGREDFFDRFVAATWWNAFIGYFPGLPSLFSLDPLTQISVPKYNPARMWTAEGAVGMGGPCVVLYPVEAPGSYQVFGRTLPLGGRNFGADAGDSAQSNETMDAASDFNLFRIGDRVNFTRVTEKELLALRLKVFEGTYDYRIEAGEFVVAEYLDEVGRLASRAAVVAAERRRAAESVRVP